MADNLNDHGEAEFLGWPPSRANVIAFSQFLSNRDMILRRVQQGEAITLTVGSKRVCTLVKPRRPASRSEEVSHG